MSKGRVLPHDWFPQPLPANVVIGERSWCYSSHAFLHYRSARPCGVRVGHDTGIYHGTFFELGPEGEVEIGSFATLVAAIICTNARIEIGDYAFISHKVALADAHAARPYVRDAGDGSQGRSSPRPSAIVVGANCWIGAHAVLLSGARLGEGSVVGAAAVVDCEVPAGAIVAGNPARVVGSVC